MLTKKQDDALYDLNTARRALREINDRSKVLREVIERCDMRRYLKLKREKVAIEKENLRLRERVAELLREKNAELALETNLFFVSKEGT